MKSGDFEVIDGDLPDLDSPSLRKNRTSQASMTIMKLLSKKIIIQGDILIRVMNKGAMSKSSILRLSFNTSFLEGPILSLKMRDLDPNHIRKDNRISQDI